MSLMRQIGVSCNVAWRTKQKLTQVMLKRGSAIKLTCRIEIDYCYLRAKRVSGKRGRGAKGKTPFVAAVEKRDGNLVRIKLSRVKGFRNKEIKRWSRPHLEPGIQVASDGLACFQAVKKAGCIHEPYIVDGGKQAVEHPAFKQVNIVLGNIVDSHKQGCQTGRNFQIN